MLVALSACPYRVGQYQSVPGVVLRSCYREPVTKSIHLFRVDREQAKAILNEGFDESTPSDFNGNSQLNWRSSVRCLSLSTSVNSPLTAVGHVVLLDGSSLAIEQYNGMTLRSPINTNKRNGTVDPT